MYLIKVITNIGTKNLNFISCKYPPPKRWSKNVRFSLLSNISNLQMYIICRAYKNTISFYAQYLLCSLIIYHSSLYCNLSVFVNFFLEMSQYSIMKEERSLHQTPSVTIESPFDSHKKAFAVMYVVVASSAAERLDIQSPLQTPILYLPISSRSPLCFTPRTRSSG